MKKIIIIIIIIIIGLFFLNSELFADPTCNKGKVVVADLNTPANKACLPKNFVLCKGKNKKCDNGATCTNNIITCK
jgi:hypothetical protein